MHSTISITNDTGLDLTLSTGVQPSLPGDDWSILQRAVGASAGPIAVLTFDRGDEITNGDTWIFSTQITFDGVALSLQEKLTGVHGLSTMAQCMTANGATTTFLDTNDPIRISANGQSGAVYTIGWTLTYNVTGFYDILYTIGVS